MSTLIETCFPYRKVSELALRERRFPRPYQLIHPWPGRRPGIVFRALILASLLSRNEETKFWKLLLSRQRVNLGKGKIFMDPFMGAGTSIFEALSLGLRSIGIDINTIAWYLAKKTLEPVNINKLKNVISLIIKKLKPLVNTLYITIDPEEQRKVIAKAFFWVKTIKCEKCGKRVRLFKNYRLARKGRRIWIYCPLCKSISLVEDKDKLVCPRCYIELKPISTKKFYVCPRCGYKGEILKSVILLGKPGMELFAVMYNTSEGMKVKIADEFDLKTYYKAVNIVNKIKDFPDLKLKFGEETKRIINYGYTNIKDLFNARQLLIIYILGKIIGHLDRDIKEFLTLTLSKTATFLSILTTYTYKGNKPESMFMLHQYMHEKMYMEINPLEYIRGSFILNARRLVEAKEYTNIILGEDIKIAYNFKKFSRGADVLLLRSSTLDLHEIPDNYVDLVITDPPHFGNIICSGIADFYYAIMAPILKDNYQKFIEERSCPEDNEIIYDPLRGKNEKMYGKMLIDTLREIRRVLKTSGMMILTFRHKSENFWDILYSSIEESGFKIIKEWPLECEGNIQPQARNVEAKEAVIVCLPY